MLVGAAVPDELRVWVLDGVDVAEPERDALPVPVCDDVTVLLPVALTLAVPVRLGDRVSALERVPVVLAIGVWVWLPVPVAEVVPVRLLEAVLVELLEPVPVELDEDVPV